MSINSKFYKDNIKNISQVAFSIFSNDEIKKYSAVKRDPFGINVPDSYDNYEPKKGGLVDLRLGTCDIYLNCTTCGLNSMDCPGHFGHTELAEPVFHYGFLPHLTTLLKCICLKCSNILLEKDDDIIQKFKAKGGKRRYKEIKELLKNTNFCPYCGTPVPKVRKEIKESSVSIRIVLEKEVGNVIVDEKTGVSTETTKIIKDYLSPRQCYNILRNVSDVDCFLLGFNPKEARPEDLIIVRFPIPPVCIRPTAKIDFLASSTMEDSLTLKIADIINSNIRVRSQMNKSSQDISIAEMDTNTLLQYHIATYFDNESASLPKSEFKTGGKPTKSISDRIKAKEGRIRYNLMGKRVDFSARSVITSDPNINIDQVGIPLKVAKDLTIPEEVTPKNIKHLTKLVKNGRDVYPGANFVFRTIYVDGKPVDQRIDLKFRKKDIILSYGDIVERHIVNGDSVLFNRQPTLHKPSMMGHQIHVLNRDDTNTFRMNVSVTKPYNADFDGDEMNLHLAQSIQARNELELIANVKYQIIGAKDSSPIIGCVQDSISGAYLLSQDSKIDYGVASNLLCTTSVKDKILKKGDIDGKTLFSNIIPDGINSIKRKNGDIFFQIENGKLKKGSLDKSQLSTSKNSIIHYIWDKFGPNKTQKFIDDTQRLVLNYLLNKGLTMGFKDTLIEDDITNQIKQLIHSKVLSSKYQLTQIENEKDMLSSELIEASLTAELNSVSANVGKMIMDTLDKSNGFYTTIKSGGKGNQINIAQIAGCLGQVSIEGSRIKKRVKSRTLPLYHQHDDTPAARGFVSSNFLDGLQGAEFFFHTMGGREGLIDTAIRTAETGYIQRKLIKSLEDLHVTYDGTVRMTNGNVVQYLYGESGIDQVKQTQLKLDIINMNNDELGKILAFTKDEVSKLDKKFKKKFTNFNQNLYNQLKSFRDNLREIYFKSTGNYKILEDTFMLPVNLNRITQEYSNDKVNLEIDPEYIIKQLDMLLDSYNERLLVLLKQDSVLMKQDEKDFKYLFKISLYEYISPKKCIFNYGLSLNEFDKLINDIQVAFTKSLAEPGEMIGIIAAQSIGEPTSQMTLNTKHSAGIASKGTANMGVPRIKEIFSFSKNIKTPQMTLYFDEKYNKNRNQVNKISSYLKHLTIGELIESAEIFYDKNGTDDLSNLLRKDDVKNPFFINNQKADMNSLPFVFRFKMNIEKLMDKETSLLDIKTKFITYWYKNFNIKTLKKKLKNIIVTIEKLAILDNSNDIIHIRFKMNNFNYDLLTSFMKVVLDTVTLKGIDNIDDIDILHEMQVQFDENGNKKIEKEWAVVSNGINIETLKTLKGIDFSRTKINDIYTAYRLYGIEAARQVITNELLLTFNAGGGSGINNAHITVLVDFMTHTGNIISIDRHGLNKLNTEPMCRASFEKTMEHFVNASIFNEIDELKSVSSRIMVGRVIQGGTGSFDLLLDTEKIKHSEYIEDETGGRTTFIPLDKEPLFEDLINFGLKDETFLIP